MENKDFVSATAAFLQQEAGDTFVPLAAETAPKVLRRENDSLDDFEHLEHDSSPVKEVEAPKTDSSSFGKSPPTGAPQEINTAAKIASETASDLIAEIKSKAESAATAMSTVEDLLGMESEDFKSEKTADLLGDFSYAPPIPSHGDDFTKNSFNDFTSSQNLMPAEREELLPIKQVVTDLADRFSDSEPEIDDFKPSSNEDFKLAAKKSEEDLSQKLEPAKHTETFKDVIDEPEIQPELPVRDYMKSDFTPEPEPVIAPKPVATPEPVIKPQTTGTSKSKTQEVIAAEAMFCKMGLDAWFNPERLNPRVESLIYWRNPQKSGAVFGGILVVLLSLAYFSFISVTAYLSLFALVGTISFRIYKNVLQAVQKTADGHPFKEQLEADIALPQEKVREITDIAVTHVNAAACELRRLFLVEDLVDSIRFGVLLWCFTYLGAWFNGMTLIIIAFVALFTLPKVYENNKTQIDANLDIVRTKLAEITSKVKAAIPIGKKSEEKKE